MGGITHKKLYTNSGAAELEAEGAVAPHLLTRGQTVSNTPHFADLTDLVTECMKMKNTNIIR